MKGADAVILSGGGAHAAADELHKTSAARRFYIFGRLVACLLLAGTLALGLVPSPAIEQAVAAAAANGTISITHAPVGGTFAKGNPVYLYSQAFSSAKNLLSYQWYRNTSDSNSGGSAISGATSANLVDESAKTLDEGTYYYYVAVTDAKTGEKAASSTAAVKIVDKGSIGDALQNGDFKNYSKVTTPGSRNMYNVPPWDTTHNYTGNEISGYTGKGFELQTSTGSNYGLTNIPKGDVVIELGAAEASSIFQTIATKPGTVYSWSLKHGARNNTSVGSSSPYYTPIGSHDVMAVIVGPALEGIWSGPIAEAGGANATYPYGQNDQSLFNKIVAQMIEEQGLSKPADIPAGSQYSTVFEGNRYYISIANSVVKDMNGPGGNPMVTYSGTYTVPEGQGASVFAFSCIDTASGFPSVGNVLSNISFAQGSPISASSDVDSQGNGILSAASKDGYAYGLLEVRGSSITQVSNFSAKKGDAVLSEDAAIVAAGGQGWFVPGAGAISFTNLTPGKTYRIVEVPTNAIGGVMGQNLTPSSVLDENCYDDFSVKPVSGGDASSIGNIQVTALSEDDGTSTLIVDPARDDVEYGVVAANAAGDGPAEPVNVVKTWASSDTGRLDFKGLNPNTSYVVVGRPKGYDEVEYGPASASGTIIKTPPASFKDVKPADVARSEDGETITVTNKAGAAQEYMVYDAETKVAAGGGWQVVAVGGSQSFPTAADKTYQIVTRSSGAVPAPGVRSYPAPSEKLAIDYVNEVIPKGATMPKTLQYRAQDANNGETWRYGTADAWLNGTGGASVPLTDALDDMVRLEAESGVESTGATFWYRTAPSYDPAVTLEKTLAVPARPEAPVQGTVGASDNAGFWIDYQADEFVVGGKDIQFRRAGTASWMRYEANTRIGLTLIGWSEKDPFEFQVRTAAVQDSAFASETKNVSVPARAEGPTAEGDAEVKGSKDGDSLRLENVTAGMEYREWGSGGTWTPIEAGDLKTAPDGTTRYVDVTKDGTYEVRLAATDDAPASFSVTASTTDSALSIKTLVRSFDQLDWGYSPSPTRPITIKNTGTATAEIMSVALGKADSSSFAVSGTTSGSVAAGATDETREVSPVAGLAPGVYDDTVTVTYRSSTGSTVYTAAVPAYVQVRQAKQDPPRDITATATDTSLTVSAKVPTGYGLADPTMEFSIDGGITWTDRVAATTGEGDDRSASTLFTGLDPATCYTVLVRMAADDNHYKLVSDEASAKFYTAKSAPAASKLIIDYVKETVSFPSGHEATSGSSGAGDAVERGGAITDYLGENATVFSLRQTASTDLALLDIPASGWTDVDIPARPAAPADAKAAPADSSKASNGSITVAGATSIEYRKAGETVWIPSSGGSATGLAAGSYEVRLPATSSSFASMPAQVEVTASKEVYATFLRNDGSEGDAAVFATQTVVPGNAATAPTPAPTREHYQFAGWFASSDGGATLDADAFDFSTALKADLTLFAKWTADSYQLAFDTDGGSEAPATQTVSYDGKAAAVTAPTKAGYTFAGWALSGRAVDNTELFDFDKTLAENFSAAGATPPQNGEAATLAAQWTALAYPVSFDAGTGSTDDDPAAPGSVAFDAWVTAGKAAPSPEPTREGYLFDGWHLVKSDGTLVEDGYQFAKTLGENLAAASLVPEDPTAPISIKARWSEQTYTLSFDPAGGAPASIGQASVKFTGKATAPATVQRAGYSFDGWRLVTGGTDDAPELAAVSFDFDASLADNLHAAGLTAPGTSQGLKVGLVAAWTAKDYTVLFDADGDGSAGDGESAKADVSFDAAVPDADAVPAAERAGWTFEHWKLAGAEDATAFDPTATLSENFAAASLSPAEDAVRVVLVPVFSENAYAFFFDADGDGAYDATKGDTRIEDVSYTGPFENPSAVAVPQKAGYSFEAWHLVNAEGAPLDASFALDATMQANFEGASAVPPKTTGATVRLVPTFAPKTYSVVLDLDGDGTADEGETSVPGVVFNAGAADSPLKKPTDPARPGYLFENWAIAGATGNAVYNFSFSLEDNCTAASFEPSASADTLMLAPVWKPCGYAVTFDARGGKPTPTGPEGTVLFNGTVAQPTGTNPERPGYAFGDWRLRVGGTDEAPVLADAAYDFALTLEANFEAAGFDMAGAGDASASDVPDDGSGVALYASWAANEYTVLFDADADGAAGEGEAAVAVKSDAKATAPTAPARPGYTFAGTWHLADRAEGSSATYDFGETLIDNLAAAGFDTAASGSGPAVPAAASQIALVPDWTENSYRLSFTANPTDDPDDPAGTYPPDDIVIADPADAGPVAFEADASQVTMPQVECTGYKFAGWRFSAATDATARYDTTLTFKANLAAAGFDVGEGDGTGVALPADGGTLELQAVWTQIPIVVTVPTTLTAQIGFDTANPDVRTVTVNPDLDPDDGRPAPQLSIVSKTEAPVRVTAVSVGAGADLAALFPEGLYKDADAVTMSLNETAIFDGKTLEEGGVGTLLPQETSLPETKAFWMSAFPGYGSPTVLRCDFALSAPMSIPMKQIADPLEAASFLNIAYTFAIVPEASSTGGE